MENLTYSFGFFSISTDLFLMSNRTYDLLTMIRSKYYLFEVYNYSSLVLFKIMLLSVNNVLTEMKLFHLNFEEIDMFLEEKKSKGFEDTEQNIEEVDNSLKRIMRHVAIHHQVIFRKVDILNSGLKFRLFYFNTFSCLQICLSIFSFMKGEFTFKMKHGVVIFGVVMNCFFICDLGQRLQDEGEKIRNDLIFGCNWLNKPNWMNKMLLFMMIQNNKLPKLGLFNVFTLNRNNLRVRFVLFAYRSRCFHALVCRGYEMYGRGSRNVIIESSNGYFLNGIQTGKCVLTSGMILCFPEYENILHDIPSNSDTKLQLSIKEQISMLNTSFERSKSLSPLKLGENEFLDINLIFFSDIVYQALNENSFYRFFDSKKLKEDFDIDPDVLLQICSTFVLLKVIDNFEEKKYDRVSNTLYDFLRTTSSTQLCQGMDVVVEYSPFVNSSFFNSWSTGIVSQVYGEDSCIFVTDVHLPSHGGGSPVYRFKNGCKDSLLGIIIEPKMWNNNVWSGNSLAVNLNAVLKHYLGSDDSMLDHNSLIHNESSEETWFDNIGCSVVRIEMDYLWGSGVVLNSRLGVIMTCAHVVNYKTVCDVVVKCETSINPGKVVFSSKLGEVYDLAIIITKFPLDSFMQLEISKDFPIKGETVYSAGFSWPNTSKLLVSKGVVSRVIIDNNMPVMVTTTCCIQPGCSGGALLRANGQLIGIPVMSLSHTTDCSPHSHYNCAVPLCLFRDVIDEFCRTADISLLSCLTTTESGTMRKWKMKNKL
ncbi:hypothetical protein LSTR_LSTR009687 [Laodelphax striatellus]|uniref:Peroxisomal leader peptide-processing protease n=1 Tax=Laodelphax striatellus TaxID=195883 RepID=A0A482WND5_LAOST|nr:hypothetical protein LSTR_LSTR009687 [Laodelphax striatellus]